MEQIIKLEGRIAEVMPIQKGTSSRTGNEWKSQDYLFEYFEWSGARFPNRVLCRIFGNDDINKFNLKQYEEVTLTLKLDANKSQDGTRWFNEVRITNVERKQAVQQTLDLTVNNQPQQQQNTPTSKENEEGGEKKDDLPF